MKEISEISGPRGRRSLTNETECTVFPCTWGARGWTGGVRLRPHTEEGGRVGQPIRKKLLNLWFEMKKKARGKPGE
jgi:hypothetical protein